MPPRHWWTEEEAGLLIALYSRAGPSPREEDIEQLRYRLLEIAHPSYRRDPSFRSLRSIRSHLSWVHRLATNHPLAWEAPTAFHEAWSRYAPGAPYVADTGGRGAVADREELIKVLHRVRVTMAEIVSSPDYIPKALRDSYAAAWGDLEDRGNIDLAISVLRGPAVDDLLAAAGLVGPQRLAKTNSVEEAVRQRRQRGGWGPFKALLRYLDSILGSLTSVIPWLDAVMEFKEMTEASAELASEASTE